MTNANPNTLLPPSVAARVLVFFAALLPCLSQTHAAETINTVVGQQVILRIEGAPTNEHHWKLNEERSEGMDTVEVKRVGWTKRGQSWFRSEVLRFVATPKKVGEANIFIEFRKKYTNDPAIRSRQYRFIVHPKPDKINTGSTPKLPWRK